MNRFYRVATDVLVAHDAVIDKIIGDEVMALYIPGLCGLPFREAAVQSGEALLRAMGYGSDREAWLPVGIGIHVGLAFVGNVGSQAVTDFTALGDTVNIAARLQAEAAPGEMILSERLYAAFPERFPRAESRELRLRGRQESLPVRIIGPDQRSAG